ncbi:hypothetical protein K5V07_09360 [Flavobacterium sp. CHNK8]|uniref:hypothetical protein n=1 Tax=Flavobacterium sp. CHNK8 TaxID=2871165 RepID=UPI001C8D4692|nr:hypothetical protein [Flavobacterium sp. CHNK8]QZK90687.1 hypothetical protein K5V07_09360 [Flavobacterium sp. CHNK8]
MIQTGIKVQRIVDFLKDNLNIIIVVPAFIGGLWQLLELLNISIAFVRFFSISQIVSDGLLVLYIIIYFSSPIFGTHLFYSAIMKSKESTIDLLTARKIKNNKTKLLVYTVSFFLLWLFGVVILWYFSYVLLKASSTKNGFILIPFLIIGCNHFLNIAYKTASFKLKHIYKVFNLFLLILYVMIIIFMFKKLHRNQFSAIPIINIEKLNLDVKTKFPNTKQEILYFNDKYIFINIVDKSKKEKVYITKLDDLFE